LLGWPGGEMASAVSQSSVGGTASNSALFGLYIYGWLAEIWIWRLGCI
jgi:hypothetical protein